MQPPNITVPFALMPGVTMTVNLECAPQIDSDRAFELARYHLTGFFYFVTYNDATRTGGPPGHFAPALFARKSDWGNGVLRWFQDHVANWPLLFHGIAAKEFFKVSIRRAPDGAQAGSWALEWNHSHRLIGFFGTEEEAVYKAASGMPALKKFRMPDGHGGVMLGRKEEPLEESEDRLFAIPEHQLPHV